MIEVRELSKLYGDRKAVDQISFEVKRGEILGFLGQNGAGKTTTMKILTGFMAASSGTAKVAGFDVFEDQFEVKRRIGYLPEVPPVYEELLVSEYLRFVAELRGIPRAERQRKIDRVVDKCQLGEVKNRLIRNLSKGYRQRIGLGQALIHEPEVLILDEPTVGLDPRQVAEVRNLIKSMKTDHTVIFSTHILSEVAAICDRIIVIDRGKIVAQESLSALGADGATARTELVVKTASDQLLQSLKSIRGVKNVRLYSNGANRIVIESEPDDAIVAEMAKVAVSSGLTRISPVQLALEEYYLGLISGKRTEI